MWIDPRSSFKVKKKEMVHINICMQRDEGNGDLKTISALNNIKKNNKNWNK